MSYAADSRNSSKPETNNRGNINDDIREGNAIKETRGREGHGTRFGKWIARKRK